MIFSGDEARLLQLWRAKRGEVPEEDLSSVLPVMLGAWTEEFNRQWYELHTEELIEEVGGCRICPTHDWRLCTLDGFVPRLQAVWEAKHTNQFNKQEDVLRAYMPQLQHNMAVCRVARAILSVIFGNSRWETYEIAADWLYQEELLIAEARFWDAVKLGTLPVAVTPPPPPKPVGIREVCLEGNNAWAAAAADWLETRAAARRNADAAAGLKQQVEDDVSRAYGHGVEVRRSKSRALTIRELCS